jgi:hypothetical protein
VNRQKIAWTELAGGLAVTHSAVLGPWGGKGRGPIHPNLSKCNGLAHFIRANCLRTTHYGKSGHVRSILSPPRTRLYPVNTDNSSTSRTCLLIRITLSKHPRTGIRAGQSKVSLLRSRHRASLGCATNRGVRRVRQPAGSGMHSGLQSAPPWLYREGGAAENPGDRTRAGPPHGLWPPRCQPRRNRGSGGSACGTKHAGSLLTNRFRNGPVTILLQIPLAFSCVLTAAIQSVAG